MTQTITNTTSIQVEHRMSLWRLVNLARPHWKPLLIATISLLLGSGITLLYPQAARIVVDDVFGENATLNITTVGIGLVALFAVQAIFVSLRYYLFTVVGDRIVADLRKTLYGALIHREMSFFDTHKTGELTSRLASDTQVLQNTVTSNLSMALRYGIQSIGGVIVLFVTSIKLSLIMLIVLPVILTIARVYGKKVRTLSKQVQDAIANSTSLAEESFSGIRTVRSFVRESHEARRYDNAVEHSFQLARERSRLGAFFSGGVSFLGYATIALVLWLGSMLVMNGDMTPGELIAYILYVLFVAFSLGVLSSLWTDFARATGAGERVFALIDEGRQPHQAADMPTNPTVALTSSEMIRFEDVSFSYPGRADEIVLRGINFNIDHGQKLALVGPSGSGKSTITSLLLRFYDIDRGHITIGNIPIEQWDEYELRQHIGIVAQEPLLFSGTIRDNIQYGALNASEEAIEDALKAAHAWQFVNDFTDGLDTLVGERGVRLSGGQKQRIAIARALLKDPQILILDEATSALDVESEHLVQQALERLMQGRTTIIIAHRLSTIAHADRVLVLADGAIVEHGTHDELMAKGAAYFSMVERQLIDQTVA